MQPQSWSAFTGFAVLYLLLGLVGRASAIDHAAAYQVWPAAGVSLLWLLRQPRGARSAMCLLAISVVLTVVMVSTGASPGLTVTAVCAGVVQAALGVALLRRWIPELLGAQGASSVHRVDVLARGTAAVLVASFVGAVIGTLGLATDTGATDLGDFVSWWAQNLTGLMAVGALGHLLWEYVRGERGGQVRHAGRVEFVLMLVASATTYGLVFTQPGLPLSFLVIPLGAWAALRFPTAWAAAHMTVFGSLAVVLTMSGRGPFGEIVSPDTQALVMQAYLMTSILTVLTIGAIRDERAALMLELATSERAAGERAELLDAMTEAMTEGLAVVDAKGDVMRMNSACRDLLTRTAEGAGANMRSHQLRRPDGSTIPAAEFPSARAIDEGIVPPQDLHLVFADGSIRIISVNAAALTGGDALGERTGALVVLRDVTAERNDRSQLAEFASTVAHDLRSPLTAVRGWLDLAGAQLTDLVDASADTVRHDAEDVFISMSRAETATALMSTLIEELLTQATAEGQQLELRTVDLSGAGGLVPEIAEMLSGEADVSVREMPAVLADEDLVRHLMSNLLDNAIKYADPARRARVVVTGKHVHQRVQIEVTDNGVGIPADQQVLVFARFHRAHAGDRRFSGTGLGLALCQTIVERHGGIIECLPAPGGVGTTFRFDLPRADRSGAPATNERPPEDARDVRPELGAARE